ncbi:MAG: cytochrome c [Alphaproteobacteria bacterium]|nr:cytochrome c [Alphaproteobacteria bacterium]
MCPNLLKILCLLAFAALMPPAVAQNALPLGPGRDETIKACSGCHGTDTFQGIRRSEGQWETTIQNMVNFGMTISDADYDTVLAYLSTYLGRTPPPAASP